MLLQTMILTIYWKNINNQDKILEEKLSEKKINKKNEKKKSFSTGIVI